MQSISMEGGKAAAPNEPVESRKTEMLGFEGSFHWQRTNFSVGNEINLHTRTCYFRLA